MIEERIKFKEKELRALSGLVGLSIGLILIFPISIFVYVKTEMFLLIALGITCLILGIIILCRLKILNSNKAIVLVLFGNYYGTISK